MRSALSYVFLMSRFFITLVTVNVDGLNNWRRREQVFNQVREMKADVVAVQETHIQNIETINILKREWDGPSYWALSDSSHTKGTGLLFAPHFDFVIEENNIELLLQKVFDGLRPGGVLVLSEKVVFDDKHENDRMAELYKGFKKTMGYSDLEISQKRNALENVLIPDNQQQHEQRLQEIGFAEVYQCFRGFNFVSYLAIKPGSIESGPVKSVTNKS